MDKQVVKSNIIAAIVALMFLIAGGYTANLSFSGGSQYWMLIAIPLLMLGILFLGIGPLIKPIRILFMVLMGAFVLGVLLSLICPWPPIMFVACLEGMFASLICFGIAISTEGNYNQYMLALEEEKRKQAENEAAKQKASQSVPTQQSVLAGGWTCTCGKVNASYVSSCSCGKNKRDIR